MVNTAREGVREGGRDKVKRERGRGGTWRTQLYRGREGGREGGTW